MQHIKSIGELLKYLKLEGIKVISKLIETTPSIQNVTLCDFIRELLKDIERVRNGYIDKEIEVESEFRERFK